MPAKDYWWNGSDTWIPFLGGTTFTPPITTSRDLLVPGTYWPGPDTTGLLPGSVMTTQASDTQATHSTAGQVIRNVRFERYVGASASNLKYVNCDFVGPAVVPWTTARGLVNVSSTVTGVEFIDCRFHPQTYTPGLNAIQGSGSYRVLRSDISGTTDGLAIYNLPVSVEQSWLHGMGYYSPSFTNTNNATHNDNVQVHGGNGHRFIGNHFESWYDINIGQVYNGVYKVMALEPLELDASGNPLSGNNHYPSLQGTSCIMFNQITSVPYNITIEKNLFSGGAYGVNANVNPVEGQPFGRIDNNVFKRNQRNAGWGWALKSTLALTSASNNKWDDGTPSLRKNA